MKTLLHKPYKSLFPFESDELDDFTVITGKNGSGKTQFIELISEYSKRRGKDLVFFISDPNINIVQIEGITSLPVPNIDFHEIRNVLIQKLRDFRDLSEPLMDLVTFIVDNNLAEQAEDFNRKNLLTDSIDYKQLLLRAYKNAHRGINPNIEQVRYAMERSVLIELRNKRSHPLLSFLDVLCKFHNKRAKEIIDSDFFNTPITEKIIDYGDLFTSRLDLIFYAYASRRDLNRRRYFDKLQDGLDNNAISDEEFTSKYPEPWSIINNILKKHNIDFHFKGIDKVGFNTEVTIPIQLIKSSSNSVVEFNHLSSGEKVIFGLIMKLFTSDYYNNELGFPDLLVLDEPDALLHPENTKLLLDVLHQTFVKKFGIKVIITTHSPSTVALSPESSIYQLTNGENTSLRKISKDNALSILTSFIPTLSIDYKNHKMVFLESHTDVFYFQSLYNKLQQEKSGLNQLYFISYSSGKGNCQQVIKMVTELRNSGNNKAFGIIDWDTKNNNDDFVFVHGHKTRYSIENFILDPIYVIGLLIQLKKLGDMESKLGIDVTYNYLAIGNESIEKLNDFCKYFFDKITENYPISKNNHELCEVKYYDGKILIIPDWYLKTKGHEIVTILKKVFPALQKYRNEGELQQDLTIILCRMYPFVPLESINILETITYK